MLKPHLFVERDYSKVTCSHLPESHTVLEESSSEIKVDTQVSLTNVVSHLTDDHCDHNSNSVSDNQVTDLHEYCGSVNKVEQFNYDLGFVTQSSTQKIAFNSTPLDMKDHKAYLSLVSNILAFGLPNYRSVRVLLPSVFNWDYLQQHVRSYHDSRLLDYLKFGFPVGLASLV